MQTCAKHALQQQRTHNPGTPQQVQHTSCYSSQRPCGSSVLCHSQPRTLHLIRHGSTEMHAYMALHRWGSPHQEPLRDPLLYDTKLSREGIHQVELTAAQTPGSLHPRPQVILTSPLTRCLETARLLQLSYSNAGHKVPVQVEPLLRERVTLSSEVGRAPSELSKEYPMFDFSHDMPDVWWYSTSCHDSSHNDTPQQHRVDKEPEDVYHARLEQLKRMLAMRQEECLVLVAHWGVIHYLSGQDVPLAGVATIHDWHHSL